jgi:hypothetical protein
VGGELHKFVSKKILFTTSFLNVRNFSKVHTLHFKTAHLRISSPPGERIKVRGIYRGTTLTPTLSRQQERENHRFRSSGMQ